jgi:hypothetical integral membrane protein (TIGR02206 family)
MPPFERYGLHHLGAILATAAIGVVLAAAARRSASARTGLWIRAGLAASLALLDLAFLWSAVAEGRLAWWEFLPLQLCDLAVLLAVYALVFQSPTAYELVYFWGGAGSVIAMLTPDIGTGFPSSDFLFFFALHGGVVAAAIVLTAGFGMRPRAGAVWRVLVLTNAYALVVGLVNLATGANFLYLCEKPAAGSLLDWLGPWPVYILGAEVVALLFFLALDAPFRLRYSSSLRSQPKEPVS